MHRESIQFGITVCNIRRSATDLLLASLARCDSWLLWLNVEQWLIIPSHVLWHAIVAFLATTHHQQNHDKGSQDSSRQKKKVGWLLAWFMAEIRGLPCGHEQCYCSNVLLWKDIRFLCKICTKCCLIFMEKTTSPDFITTKVCLRNALYFLNKRLQHSLRRSCHSAKSD